MPPDSDVFTTPFSSQNAQFAVIVLTGQQLSWTQGKNTDNRQRQLNIIDNLSIQRGSHNVKLGVDYRWISPVFNPRLYSDTALFFTVPSLVAGNPFMDDLYCYSAALVGCGQVYPAHATLAEPTEQRVPTDAARVVPSQGQPGSLGCRGRCRFGCISRCW